MSENEQNEQKRARARTWTQLVKNEQNELEHKSKLEKNSSSARDRLLFKRAKHEHHSTWLVRLD